MEDSSGPERMVLMWRAVVEVRSCACVLAQNTIKKDYIYAVNYQIILYA